MTAMRQALKQAGMDSGRERLEAIARDVLDREPRDFTAATTLLVEAIGGDAALLRELCGEYLLIAARGLLSQISAADRKRNGGQEIRDIRTSAAAGRSGHARSLHSSPVATINAVAREAYLSRIVGSGKALSDCTKAELVAFAARDRRAAWLYEALAQSMPEVGIVADYYSDAEIAAIDSKWNGGAA